MVERQHHSVHDMKKLTGEKRGRWTVVDEGRIERVISLIVRNVSYKEP